MLFVSLQAKEAAMVAVNRIFHTVSERESAPLPQSLDPLHVRQTEKVRQKRDVAFVFVILFALCFQANELRRREQVAAHLREATTLTEKELAPLFITMQDFLHALPKVSKQ